MDIADVWHSAGGCAKRRHAASMRKTGEESGDSRYRAIDRQPFCYEVVWVTEKEQARLPADTCIVFAWSASLFTALRPEVALEKRLSLWSCRRL